MRAEWLSLGFPIFALLTGLKLGSCGPVFPAYVHVAPCRAPHPGHSNDQINSRLRTPPEFAEADSGLTEASGPGIIMGALLLRLPSDKFTHLFFLLGIATPEPIVISL